MQITRREWMLATSAFGAALALAPKRLLAAELKPVRFGIGQKAMAPNVINCVIGEVLGFNKEEGLTIRPQALGGNSNVQVAVDRGDVDIGIGVPSFGLPLLAKGEWNTSMNYYEYTYPYKWDIVVKPGSDIKSYQDLKGKKIGVSDFAATDYPVTKNVLKSLGIDPEKDVKFVAVGNGVPAGVALERGAIDALSYYDTGFGQIEAAGIAITFLPRPDKLPMVGGQFLMARKETFNSQRDMLVGYGRSVCKASQFILADPDAGARAFLAMYPEAAPRGSGKAEAVKSILNAISRRIKLYNPPYPNTKMGAINETEFQQEAELNQLNIKDFKTFYTNSLIDDINKFDVAKIQAMAKSYQG
ncbi:ABC transporter substrate-binding protein [Bordetella genomosp. 9]|uniref:ABC transporter substrate-binding protein n=1 Tax=Bordetella genomosp. 9 TaxID=1416803 RepID=A0A261RFR0_9BORD|nr:ABC transporter substrate-binding protein [Bordetella genomosp. 9]OZI23866.1 ABC transporter substrate-binding protein [Bordetella genomosp. 9]